MSQRSAWATYHDPALQQTQYNEKETFTNHKVYTQNIQKTTEYLNF